MADEKKLLENLKFVTGELRAAHRKLREVEAKATEPVAIVAMSCRFPGGVGTPEDLWRLVTEGRDAIGPFPTDRGWDLEALADQDSPDSSYGATGGFLDGAAEFDAGLFEVSPREATAMDPQQRLLLQACWEALERAGIDPTSLRGDSVGVFAGTNGQDYAGVIAADPEAAEGYLATGSAASVLSGRIAYTLGLEGPAVTVDTACSSSLVALHLAMQALRAGECRMALVGGVTVMSTPAAFVEFSRQKALAPDGRCKAFGAGADGTGWGEGVGVLVVMRLSAARAAGHRVLAVVRGSAVNQDGASNGLTAPNGPSQQRVIRAALESAGLTPSDVDMVEAHGTGTRLGDPIEAEALLATYGRDRARPLWLGSVKSNIGHTQAAAGVAGIIKAVMALRHGVLPATLHAETPSPHVNWAAGTISLLSGNQPWPEVDRPRRAAVSSFGVSGTNAHTILEQAPEVDAPVSAADPAVVPLLLSGRTQEALRAQAAGLRVGAGSLLDTAYSLATTRAAFQHRAVVTARDASAADAALAEIADGGTPAAADFGVDTPGKLAFLFTGQGSQRLGMGEGLRVFPVFASTHDEIAARLSFDAADLDQTGNAQPALFALQVSLLRLLESLGLRPDLLVGHSIGEVAAAHAAGILSLDDACTLVSARARLMQALPASGAMLAVEAAEGEIELLDGLDLAAVNSDRSIVVSGDCRIVEQFERRIVEQNRRFKRLTVSHAFHSRLMDPMLDEFRQAITGLSFNNPTIPLLNSSTGDPATAEYWVRQVRETVRFAAAARELRERGANRFLELGPDGVLSALVGDGSAPVLRSGRDDHETLVRALGRVHTLGTRVNWPELLPGGARTDLPTYPFERRRYWPRPSARTDVTAAGLGAADHPLLAAAAPQPDGGHLFTGRLSPSTHPWLTEHRIGGEVLVPGTAFVELAMHAGDQVGSPVLDDLTISAPLPLTGAIRIQVSVAPAAEDGTRSLDIHSSVDGLDWTLHAQGRLGGAATTVPLAWPPKAEPVDLDAFYATAADNGFGYGPLFQGLRAAWRTDDTLYGEVQLPESAHREATRFGVHPALLDAALHPTGVDPARAGLPFAWSGVTRHATGATGLRVAIKTTGTNTYSLTATDLAGTPVITVNTLTLRPPIRREDDLFALDWARIATQGSTKSVLCGEPAEWAPADAVLWRVPSGDIESTVVTVLAAMRAWLADDRFAESTLVLFTRGAVAALPGDEIVDVAGAAAGGLVRSAQAEHPGRFLLLDGDHEPGDGVVASLLDLDEPQLVLRGDEVFAPRLARATGTLSLPDSPAWRLQPGGDALDALALNPLDAGTPGPGEVRVEIRATGVNFRDVLIALGQYPEHALLGSEGAGVVVEVGPDVDLRLGDRVFGLLAGGFGPSVVVDHRMLAPMPDDWSFAEAATVPMAFLTAYFGLVDLAGLQVGERVLVHAAAGGVGMAAVQVARHLGAEIYGTASPAKWPVTGLDDAHLASSRDLGFADKFPEVDVVLNALAGEFIDASAGLLGEGGRFIEMGKADLRTGIPGYRAFDLSEAGPDRLREMLLEVLDLFAQGVFTLLPWRAWDVREAQAAFRFVGQGKHIGKNVLTIPRPVDPQGTVLVTGGTGVLGRIIARHLADQYGVRKFVFTNRSGAGEPHLPGVRVVACDMADLDAVTALLADIPDLTGVVHAAGVADDGVLEALTPERIASVLAPKATGAVLLDDLVGDIPLFALYSSVSSVFGSPGQANYAAANAVLDAIAVRRKSRGLAATSLSWGLWATTSAISGSLDSVDLARATRVGPALTEAAGLALFDAAHRDGRAHLVTIAYDPATARKLTPVPALLRGLVRTSRRVARTGSLDHLRTLGPAEAGRALLAAVRAEITAVLGHTSAETGRPFKEMGFDSLTAVEFRNRLTTATGLRLPATAIFDYPTPDALVDHLVSLLPERQDVREAAVVAPQSTDEPIAIVGMACRFPGGVDSPDDLWELVFEGREGIGPFPTDRGWDLGSLYNPDPDVVGTTYARAGGFLDDVAGFDARLFGVSPREATAMDPQQRLLLEATWEAFEDAGIDPASARGSRTGVFVGVAHSGYGVGVALPEGVEGHFLTGSATSVASGRLAYFYGLEGPAVTVDTACSSSLVALHLATRALRSGECSMAIAGGVTVMVGPGIFTEFSRQRGLSADGRCKSFSANADGTGWSEGVGVLLVERLSDAVARGHRVLAVVRGSAVNSDGASNGLTAPNGPSQQRVIQSALTDAGLVPSDVDAVEAHGTGTVLGDPIEAQALLATYGQDRDEPLWLGSLKSNIGHAQAAAGVAGIIKVVQALRHEVLPRTLHAENASDHIDWSSGAVELLTESRPWARGARPRRAGVSSFGVSGTNVHTIIEEAPATAELVSGEPAYPVPVVVTAHSPQALAARVDQLQRRAADLRPVDLARELAVRARQTHRIAFTAATPGEVLDGLAAASPQVAGGEVAFLFTGQGSQRAGMGSGLHAAFPVFASAFDEIRDRLPFDDSAIDETGNAQPALFALQVALFRLLESWGVHPDVLVGHSIGEVAAAHVAGILSLDDACTLVSARARLMQALPSGGAMLAIEAAEGEIDLPDGLDLAAVNSDRSIVVSGDCGIVEQFECRIVEQGRRFKRLIVSHAFHSRLMDPMLDEFRRAITGLSFNNPTIPLLNSSTGDPATAGYWVRQVRETVRFAAAVRSAGAQTHLELGPDGILSALVDHGIPTLRPGRDEVGSVIAAVTAAHARGATLDLTSLTPGARRVRLPAYPFQRERFWLDHTPTTQVIDAYRVTWTPIAPRPVSGTWLVPDHLRAALEEAGLTTTLDPGAATGVLIEPTDPVDLVHDTAVPRWVITRGATRTTAQVWGLGRVAALESPTTWGGLVELPDTPDGQAIRRLVGVLGGPEDQVSIRSDGAFARRLTKADPVPPVPWRPEGTVLVTGGTGALGAQVVRHLAARGVRVVVASRQGPGAPGAVDLPAEVVACDVADRESLAALLAVHPVTAVVHAAGIGEDAPFGELTSERLAEVLRPKADAAWLLHELVPDAHLVLFSSIAGVWGSGGQAAYAAANAELDALAEHRAGLGLPTTSIAWGPWADAGMAAGAASDYLISRGLRPLRPAQALAALDAAIASGLPTQTVADLDWPRFLDTFTAARPSPLLSAFALVPETPEENGFAAHLRALSTMDRERAALDLVTSAVGTVLGYRDAVDPSVTFAELGFDSLTAVDLRNRLSTAVGFPLPSTLAYDHPTAADLAEHLLSRLIPRAVESSTVERKSDDDPIVIVGMACRLPGGVTSPDELWDMVVEGRDGIGGFPVDRGWDLAGADYPLVGGFVHDATGFDAELFGISPREATAMDPQQRVLLEASWEAVERAGIDAGTVRGSRGGVFVGASGSGYGFGQDTAEGTGHLITGTATSVISGRVSYLLGLQGPALTVDTACSSGLVALHLAARALRHGECEFAIVGGVTVMPSPAGFIEFAKQGGLAADGRCKAFADAADGTGWSEGVAVVVVERLSDAIARGHDVLAVVSGSAVNSDGASNGLTAPNGPAQQRVIRDALADAGLTTSDVDLVEGHGTGTRLGDPIEAQALLATYGQDRVEPLWLGSLKSNIGHTQAASGLVGVIKAVQALRNGVLPKTLHVDEPSSHVDWSAGDVRLLTDTLPWPDRDRPRRAAVSSFGISGTNAHTVLEQAPVRPAVDSSRREAPVVPLLLSARGEVALRSRATDLLRVDADPVDLAHSLATTRATLDHRAVALDRAALAALSEGGTAAGLVTGITTPGRLAFLFTGQGSQRAGMGRDLRMFPVFGSAFDEVVTRVPFDDGAIDQTGNAQVALFALEVALFRLVESWGIRPDVVVGHSIGEVAAAHVAGILSLDDACTLVSARARLMQALPTGGAMLAIEAAEAELDLPDGLDLAAVNSDRSIVVSGDCGIVEQFERRIVEQNRRFKRLTVSHAFHSRLMDPMLDEFRQAIAGLSFNNPTIPLVNSSTGDPATAEYWVRQVRETVRFADAVREARERGATKFLELGPEGVLTALVRETGDGVFATALRSGQSEPEAVVRAVATLHAHGTPVDWQAMIGPWGGTRIALPVYPFQRKRFWLGSERRPAVENWRYAAEWIKLPEPTTTSAATWYVLTDGPVPADISAAVPTTEDLAAATGILCLAATPDDVLPTAGHSLPVWVITRDALATVEGAATWGLGRVAALELPHWRGIVDLPAVLDDESAARFHAVLAGDEDQVAIRPDGAFARRLRPAPLGDAQPWRPKSVLVTGGTGALGGHVTRWLAERGVAKIVLASRRGPDAPGADELPAEVVACDVTDRAALAALLAEHPVDAIIHTAGVVDAVPLADTTPRQLAEIAHAKVTGAVTLHELAPDAHLVLFSSIAGTWGAGGQAGYSAANAALDGLAEHRRALGLPVTSIAWGPWAGDGMLGDGGAEDYLRRRGLRPMSPDHAVLALAQALDHPTTAVTIADVDWPRFTATFTATRRSPLLADLTPVVAPSTKPSGPRKDLVLLVRAEAAAVLGHESIDAITADRAFADLGFDSLTSVELRDRLAEATGTALPAGLVFDYPTPAALAEHLAGDSTVEDQTPVAPVDDPIAIVAMACRFPGGIDTPDDLWKVLVDEREVSGPFPADRGWDLASLVNPDPDHPGTSYVDRGAFLVDPARFDADLFGISPREAIAMDPQQRLLLETTWEVFERAGIDPKSLRGSRTGVFAGTNGQDYTRLTLAVDVPEGHVATGGAASVMSGRVSYAFGLEGPALTVDTACSSALVALHLAAQALRQGECALAVAAGVTVMATPGAFVEFSRQRGLAADGRCKPFSDNADGTAWGEGIGVLLVERLSDAQRNGHPVLAVIEGSAVNSDGASNGLTAPNGPSQQRVIRAALASAGLVPSDVDVVEAHGTGTTLGDPIEAEALLATYGRDRAEPLWLGSVKSNIGHTQAAAGAAGVIKAVLALRHETLPVSLHAGTPTTHVDWSTGAVELLSAARPWPAGSRPRRAGVSAFGISGTNAHVILGDAHISAVPSTPTVEVLPEPPLPVSANSARALAAQLDLLERFDAKPADIAHTLATRAVLPHRAVVLNGRVLAAPEPRPTRLGYLFTGQGSQRVDMGEGLRVFPVFASVLDDLHARLPFDDDAIDQTGNAQVALFALQVAQFRLLESWGVHPELLIGHSIGEVAAAHVTGILSLDDACTLVAARARLMQALPAGGAMLAVEAAEDEIELPDGLDLAAVNSDRSIVVSGDCRIVEQFERRIVEQNRRFKRLTVSHAFHSRLMDPMLDEFRRAIAGLSFNNPTILLLNSSTGDPATAEYWVRQVRETVRFAAAAASVEGVAYLELGPDGVLSALVDAGIPLLRRDRDDVESTLAAVAHAFTSGANPDWAAVLAPWRGRLTDLPTYPFQGERYWQQVTAAKPAGLRPTGHPLLAATVTSATGGHTLLTGVISPTTHPWLADHKVHGKVVVPGTALLDLVLHAASRTGQAIDELALHAPLVIDAPAELQLTLDDSTVTVHSRLDDGPWTHNASAALTAEATPEPEPITPVDADELDLTDHYPALAEAGLDYGPTFRGLASVRVTEHPAPSTWFLRHEVHAEAAITDSASFGLHPALLDAALQAIAAAEPGGAARVPYVFGGVTLHATKASRLVVRITPTGPDTVRLHAETPDGTPVITITSLTLRPTTTPRAGALFEVDWTPTEHPTAQADHVSRPATAAEALTAIQDWLTKDAGTLTVVTEGAVVAAAGDRIVDPAQAAIWGLVRTAQSEHPGRFALVDGSPAVIPGEPQLAVRAEQAYLPRLVRSRPGITTPEGSWRLVPGGTTLADLRAIEVPRTDLAPGEVRVDLRATGVNFRDVLITLGTYPEAAELGSEGAGVITEVGAGVTDLRVGDRVFGLLSGGFGTSAVVDRRLLAAIPDGWSFADAAAVPMAYLTAYYALVDLAGLSAGERVLVHAAAGGVGGAAVQIAQHLGAEVFGTASPAKWAATGLDDSHLASSRDLGFADKFPAVDVVLNALAGKFIDASAGLLGGGGRFIEMGKADLRSGIPGYRAFDLWEAGPDRLGEMLAEVLDLFAAGVLTLPPIRAWGMREATAALRFVAQGSHIGKNVLTPPPAINPQGTVLVTGGSGALGTLLARHLIAEYGVERLVLASRRGTGPDLGDRVRHVTCDVSDRTALADLIASIPDLAAVIHAAGTTDDGLVESLDENRLRSVAAKADAALHLAELPGDWLLVLYSSVAATLGTPGQGNYAAANAVLDAVAHHRAARGLPTVSIAWGLWERVGDLSAHLDDVARARASRLGAPLSDVDGLALFDAAIQAGKAHAVAAALDVSRVGDDAPALLRGLAPAKPRRVTRAQTSLELVRAEVAAVLGHATVDTVDPGKSFSELGFDSLTAVELRNRLTSATGQRLPATLIFDHPTPAALAAHVDAATVVKRAEVRAPVDEPIAIVAMSCRFPGGIESPDDLWRLVAEGGDAIGPFPADRGWDLDELLHPVTGTSDTNRGGFVEGAGRFDAALFGISPREALAMDPQQRLLLEASWEVFERAGIDPLSLRGTDAGVFVGAAASLYGAAVRASEVEGHQMTGVATSVASGRLAYFFGLEGPAVTVDTACSSSLVALHWAARSLRSGECSMALVGGVAVMATPGMFTEFSRQGGLAADGRCKSFSADADGTGWSEGVGVLLVERLSDALERGHEVLAVVRGSAVNSDGASNGLTAPNGPSQQRVIRSALAAAGLEPSDVDAVEAHGTGTVLGDPIEAQALLATYGQERDRPLWLGSLKSNIGHTQAAAGVAGIIKLVQALRHETLPSTLHVEKASEHIDWASGAVELVTGSRPWPRGDRPRRAGISSFGVSGTNVHTIIEEAPAQVMPPRPVTPTPPVVPLVVSAGSPAALEAQIAAIRTVDEPQIDVARALVATRADLPHRAVLLDPRSAPVATGIAGPGRLVYLFTGQGSQRAGMGQALRVFPAFAEAFDEIRARLSFDDSAIDETGNAQPALFALQVALFRLLESWGVNPDVVVGHSIGEVAAAHVAGILSLDDACTLVSARARLMQALPAGGAMLAIEAAESEIELPEGLDLAAVNSDRSIVASGDCRIVEQFECRIVEQNRRFKRLTVSHAFHSRLMDPMLDEFRRAIAGLSFTTPTIRMVTSSTGDPATAEYWVRQVRETVRFADAVRGLADATFLELGPDGVLSAMVGTGTPLLRSGHDEPTSAITALAAAHVRGVAVDWTAVLGDGPRAALPTYPFDRTHFWLTGEPTAVDSWRYRVDWAEVTPEPATGHWLVVGSGEPGIVEALRKTADVTETTVDDLATTPADGVLVLPDSAENVLRVLKANPLAPVWAVTRGVQTDPDQARVWGLGRVAALERRWGGLIDVDGDPTALPLAGGEDQLVLRDGRVLARRLVRAPESPGTRWTPDGPVLITGGTGALGGHVARWLVRLGATHLVLTSRRGPDAPGVAALVAQLGVRVDVVACDAADRDALAALVAEYRPTVVVHAAGVAGTTAITELDELAATQRAKVDGARHLDELLPDAHLVLFSSIAGVWGSGGQAAYAAANAALDALAARRRLQGRKATAVSWGPWADGGLAAGEAESYLRERGLNPMAPARAVAALGAALAADETHVVIADVDWDRFLPTFTAARPSPLLAAFQFTATETGRTDFAARLATATPAERDRTLLDLVRRTAAEVLGHTGTAAVPARASFADLGFDSLAAVRLRAGLAESTGLDLPTALVFDHPTPVALAAHLAEELATDPDEAEIRRALAELPIERLRAAGVLELLRAADSSTVDEDVESDSANDIDLMDVDALIQSAFDNPGT
ncbi:acyl transferase domain-containing protein/NADPH:quinone reductase-like Zn-dependent oxidoreductase/acyl carrier protein [Actinokineospora baliensis]|uniref:type I polyketide synthase n=1 Tax=Actinokineospora baliensis TaxID=547056 RepID=UPI001EF851FC|nr:type I polyketide synthase [Actinokineospora baliensis]MBM7769833.1 acyl transferase domain-containing protein/NADPH:quinone reductase-like Zn-dependent oxidoreductase/acyl carrier protein [Actinokineospora baliensis]